MKLANRLAYLVLVLISLRVVALAQESRPDHTHWDFSVWFAPQTGEENSNSFSEAQAVSAGFAAGRTLKDVSGAGWRSGALEYMLSLGPLFLQLRPQLLHGITFEPVVLRWNSHRSLRRAKPYLELAGGAVHTNANLPAGDTSNFNFTAKGGGGIYLYARSRRAFDLGLAWSHISNANLGRRNPEFNGIEVRIAYHWYR